MTMSLSSETSPFRQTKQSKSSSPSSLARSLLRAYQLPHQIAALDIHSQRKAYYPLNHRRGNHASPQHSLSPAKFTSSLPNKHNARPPPPPSGLCPKPPSPPSDGTRFQAELQTAADDICGERQRKGLDTKAGPQVHVVCTPVWRPLVPARETASDSSAAAHRCNRIHGNV